MSRVSENFRKYQDTIATLSVSLAEKHDLDPQDVECEIHREISRILAMSDIEADVLMAAAKVIEVIEESLHD